MTVTRTLGPLHFEDLEPHRFEDLVRQLVYDLRPWNDLEAVGRVGSDEGFDIRAREGLAYPLVDTDSVDDADADPPVPTTRVWKIQCKREKRIGPKRIAQIVADSIDADNLPDVFMLVAACDFSVAAHSTFRTTATNLGVREMHLWGKGEVEDHLVRPENDHLLFAYFGISLQARRRSTAALMRARLATKRRLIRVLEQNDISSEFFTKVMLRPVEDGPGGIDPEGLTMNGLYVIARAHVPPDHLMCTVASYLGSVDSSGAWDAFEGHDAQNHRSYSSPDASWRDQDDRYRAAWEALVPLENRAYIDVCRPIPYDHIVAVDEVGEAGNDPPHLIVARGANGSVFASEEVWMGRRNRGGETTLPIRSEQRVAIFPANFGQQSPRRARRMPDTTDKTSW